MQEEPCKLHANSTSSSCSTDCSNAKAVLLKVAPNASDCDLFSGIKWILINRKPPLTLRIHHDKQESHQHVVSLVHMLRFKM